jgi:hypothetical protein
MHSYETPVEIEFMHRRDDHVQQSANIRRTIASGRNRDSSWMRRQPVDIAMLPYVRGPVEAKRV